MATTFDIQLPHYNRGFHLVTRNIVSHLPELPESGLLFVFIKHTSAALTLNENADPSVRHDFNTFSTSWYPTELLTLPIRWKGMTICLPTSKPHCWVRP